MMRTELLSKLAVVDISNVDKKIKDGEKPVRLCNFVDVYHNWAITRNLYQNLMSATANDNQIARFSIKKGQVAITKDSETRDDIGIPAYMADDFDDVVLGYHCALITPIDGVLSGAFLNVVLHSPYAGKYFEANASGSGQRYTLTNEIIGSFPVPMIPFDDQEQIASVFESIDKKLEVNNAIISELEAMSKDIYDYWFVQFDFPDENGKPYKSSGGKMVWNEDLRMEIPEGWESGVLANYVSLLKDGTHNPPKRIPKEAGVALLTGEMFGSSFLEYDKATYISWPDFKKIHSSYEPEPGDVIITKIGTIGKVNTLRKKDVPLAIHCNSAVARFQSCFKGLYPMMMLKSDFFQKHLRAAKGQSIQEFISLEKLGNVPVLMPAVKVISEYNNLTNSIFEKLENLTDENNELASLRDWLLPMLMNGQVKVG